VRLAILIPARYGAQRLPGKPLADLCGAPLIVRVCERAALVDGIGDLCVATDDERIASAVSRAGFRALMTPCECRNGTERIAAASEQVRADGYLNVQGDEPLVDPGAIAAVADLLQRLAHVYLGPDVKFPPMPDPPPGFVSHITVERTGGHGPWAPR